MAAMTKKIITNKNFMAKNVRMALTSQDEPWEDHQKTAKKIDLFRDS